MTKPYHGITHSLQRRMRPGLACPWRGKGLKEAGASPNLRAKHEDQARTRKERHTCGVAAVP